MYFLLWGLKHRRLIWLSSVVFMRQELKEMLERHRSQNEAWLRARAAENDRERRELCRLRVCKQTNKQTNIFVFTSHSCSLCWISIKKKTHLKRLICSNVNNKTWWGVPQGRVLSPFYSAAVGSALLFYTCFALWATGETFLINDVSGLFLRRRFCRTRRGWRRSRSTSRNGANISSPSCSSSKECEKNILIH